MIVNKNQFYLNSDTFYKSFDLLFEPTKLFLSKLKRKF